MHELAIAQSIVEAVEAKASECNAVHVKGVRLKIGEASGVVTDSLTFCFEMMVASQTLLHSVRHAKSGPTRLFLVLNSSCLRWSLNHDGRS